jgi:hypothetical protein
MMSAPPATALDHVVAYTYGTDGKIHLAKNMRHGFTAAKKLNNFQRSCISDSLLFYSSNRNLKKVSRWRLVSEKAVMERPFFNVLQL